jgi:hypothetical protein
MLLTNRLNGFGARRRGGDPYFANVVLLAVNDNKANGTTSFVDQSPNPKTITTVGNGQYSTAQAPAGMTSSYLGDGANDGLSLVNNADFNFGTGDFTVEMMLRYTDFSNFYSVYSYGYTSAGSLLLQPRTSDGGMDVYANGLLTTSESSALPSAGVWFHYAVSRSSGTLRLYRDGLQKHSVANTANISNAAILQLFNGGAGSDTSWSLKGHAACVRVTKGVDRYPGGTSFTPPSLPLPSF